MVTQEAVAGEGGHLLADQLLFVEAVAQAFLGGGWVNGQGREQVVAAEPLAIVGEARVGFHHEAGIGLRVDGEQAAARQHRAGADLGA